MLAESTSGREGEMSQEHRHRTPHLLAEAGFSRWRQLRPFWAGVFLIIGGALDMWWSFAPPSRPFHTGLGRSTSVIFAVLLIGGTALVWLAPWQRKVFGAAVGVVGLFTAITAHPGGLACGLLVLVGAAMLWSWVAPHSLANTVAVGDDVEAPAAPGAAIVPPPDSSATPGADEWPSLKPRQSLHPAFASPAPIMLEPVPVVVSAPLAALEPAVTGRASITPEPGADAGAESTARPVVGVALPELPPAVEWPQLLPPPVPVEVPIFGPPPAGTG